MGRSSFVFYKDWRDALSGLSDDLRLEVYDSIIEYAISGKEPVLRPMAGLAFNFIKATIDRDAEKYRSIVERNQGNGSKGGRPKKETQNNPKNPVGILGTQNNPKNLDNDNVNDNVNDNGNTFSNEKDISELPNGNSSGIDISLSVKTNAHARENSGDHPDLPPGGRIEDGTGPTMPSNSRGNGEDFNPNAESGQGVGTFDFKGKKPPKKPNSKKTEFETKKYEAFEPAIARWLEYKAEIKDSYKSQNSVDTMARNLHKLSRGQPEMAMQIVNQSIGNNWKGLFELKNGTNSQEKRGEVSDEYRADILRRIGAI